MPTIDLGFRAREWQAECFRGFKRFSVVVVHRRGGKTVMAIMRLVDDALRNTRERPRYAYVAPLLKQAKGIAWDYLRAYARKVPGTTINEGELWVEFPNRARIRLYGADNPDSMRGFYFDGIVGDEVAQWKPEVWGEILRPALADREGWALFIGTPKGINLFSQLYHEALTKPAEWYAARFDYLTTQALKPEEIAEMQRDMRPSEWRQEMLCDFTASSDNTLIPIDDALAASRRHLRSTEYDFAPKVLGIDVAWQGGDANVIFPRQGLAAFTPRVERGLPEKTFANIVAGAIAKFQPDAVFIDTTGGYGGEVVSRLRDTGHVIHPVVFSWKASDDRFANLRAEMWFKMADWLKQGAIPSKPPELLSQLCAPTYSNDNAANRLKLESKDDIRERLGSSPDLADALALTFAFPVYAGAQAAGQVRHEWDPYRSEAPATGRAETEWDPMRI